MHQWYYLKEGKEEGPVTAQQIAALVKDRTLSTTDLMVWRDGLPEWQFWKDSGIQEEAPIIPPPSLSPSIPSPSLSTASLATPSLSTITPVHSVATNPYLLSERNQNALSKTLPDNNFGYNGYGRLRYFLTIMIMTVLFYGISFAIIFGLSASNSMSPLTVALVTLVLMGGFTVASLYVGALRTRNLGMSGWAVLWTFVPIMNFWIGWRMIACPEGYEDHRTLDTPAKVITGVWIGLILLAFVGSALGS
jgi:uncharacterized membrane protein YhaH (DUF805 family)